MARFIQPDSLASRSALFRRKASHLPVSLLLASLLLSACSTTSLAPEAQAPGNVDASVLAPSLSRALGMPLEPVAPGQFAAATAASSTEARASETRAPALALPARLPYTVPGPIGLVSVEVAAPQKPRTLDLTAPAQDVWVRIRNGFAVPNLVSPLVVERQAWYLARSDYFVRMLERASIYLYHVVEELEKRGMPTELALLPFIESAYNPMALSTARAAGLWQFIPSTGKQYNLRQDWWRDERRDIVASTEAALTYLQYIYEMHGDWHLALASYNWGEGAVKRAIEKNRALGQPTDYLSLNMPDETRFYIPKLQAVKNIIAHPELFNITLPRVVNQPYFATVQKQRDIDIRTAAKLADMPLADFRALNPSFNRPIMSGPATLLLPTDKASLFASNLANHREPLVTWKSYTLGRKDRLDTVAKKFGMTVATLREVNGIDSTVRIRPGLTVLVRAGGSDLASAAPSLASPPAAGNAKDKDKAPGKVLPAKATAATAKTAVAAPAAKAAPTPPAYVARRGDTLFAIAQKHGTTVDRLKALNGLKNNTVNAGQKLKLPQ